MTRETGATKASPLRVTLVAGLALFLVTSAVSAQEPSRPSGPPAGTPETQTPAGPTAPPLDPTRPGVPSPPVDVPIRTTPDAPPTIFVPPPTIPSARRPDILAPGPSPLSTGRIFTPHLGVTAAEGYSDNFNLSSTDRQSNFRTTLSPSIGVDINGAFTKGLVSYTLSAAYDTSRSSNGVEIFHALAESVTWYPTPLLTLTLTDSLTRSDEPTQADRLGLRRERQTFLSNLFGANATYFLGPINFGLVYQLSTFFGNESSDTISHNVGATVGTTFYETNSVNFGYTFLLSDTSASSSVSTGTQSNEEITGHSFTASYSRKLTSLLTGGISGTYAIRRSNLPAGSNLSTGVGSGLASGNDYDLWTISLFNSYSAGPFSMTGSLGYSQVNPTHGQSESTPYTATTIAYRFAKAVATLSVDSGFAETFSGGENFGVVETRGVQGTLLYPLTPFLSTLLTAHYRVNSGQRGVEDQHTWGATAALNFQLTRWLTLTAEYSHTEWSGGTFRSATGANSGSTGGDVAENRGRISLSAGF